MKTPFKLLPLLAVLAFAPVALAEEAEAPVKGEANVEYVELSPSFVTNFQSAKIRYLKADVTLKVKGDATAQAINRNQPLIRNNLVMLFSRQTEEDLNSPEGRQHLKDEALQEVLNALQSENEPTDVQEVLFTSFIVD